MHLIKPDVRRVLPMASRGEGCVIYTDDGRRILDACSGAISCSLGYGHPHIIDKMLVQAQHTTTGTWPRPRRVSLCTSAPQS